MAKRAPKKKKVEVVKPPCEHDFISFFENRRSYTADGCGYIEFCRHCKTVKRFELGPDEVRPIISEGG